MEAVRNKDYSAAYRIINNTEPPIEWFEKSVSEVNGEEYLHLPIEFLESLVNYIFGGYEDVKIDTQITRSNSMYAVTTNIVIGYGFAGEFQKQRCGTATVIVKPIKVTYGNEIIDVTAFEQLVLATPLSLTKARINAIKNIGSLFGVNVNRSQSLELTDNKRKILDTLNKVNNGS